MKFLDKKATELTAGETIGFTLVLMGACYLPVLAVCEAIEHWDDITSFGRGVCRLAKKKFVKEKIDYDEWSTEEKVEDD